MFVFHCIVIRTEEVEMSVLREVLSLWFKLYAMPKLVSRDKNGCVIDEVGLMCDLIVEHNLVMHESDRYKIIAYHPGGALGYFLGGYVPPGTPNWHPVLKKFFLKIDTPF